MASDVPPLPPPIADLPGPGIVRRRALRAAGLNISLADFTAEERRLRGFIAPVAPRRLDP